MGEERRVWKRIACVGLALAMLITSAPVDLYATGETTQEKTSEEAWKTIDETAFSGMELPESETLFQGYVEKMFYGEAAVVSVGEKSAGAKLTGDAKKLYDCLAQWVKAVAAGEKTSSYVAVGSAGTNVQGETITPEYALAFTKKDVDIEAVIQALLSDYPYEMFWYDKTRGIAWQEVLNTDGTICCMELIFMVADEYREGERCDAEDVAPETIKGAAETAAAVAEAKRVVTENAQKSDYEKLEAYKTYICEQTAYNYGASSEQAAYGNPWQLIWVFDKDPDTKIVCEGYAKAFQYLCDLSEFQKDISCYSVTGYLNDKDGGHMWNVVTMEDGKSYLVDVTNIDTGYALFLRGGTAVKRTLTIPVYDETGTYSEQPVELDGVELLVNGTTWVFLYDLDNPWESDVLMLAEADYVYQPDQGSDDKEESGTPDQGNGTLKPEGSTEGDGNTTPGTSDTDQGNDNNANDPNNEGTNQGNDNKEESGTPDQGTGSGDENNNNGQNSPTDGAGQEPFQTDAVATVSTADWTSAVTVTAPTGFLISQTVDGTYAESFRYALQSETTAGSQITYYLKQEGTGYVTEAKTLSVKIDNEAPKFTGESGIKITDRNAWWQQLFTTVTFGNYQPQDVTVRAVDNLSGVREYYYYVDKSGNTTAKTAAQLASIDFIRSESGKFVLNESGSYVVYAYAVDKAGNHSSYISSDGILIDASIDLSEEATVKVNGTYTYTGEVVEPEVTVTIGSESLVRDRDYTVSCNDKNAGKASVTIAGKGRYSGTVTKSFTISKARVVITASNKVIKVGSELPKRTYRVSGLLGGDELLTAPKLSYDETPDTSKMGTYRINVSGADAGENYEIQYIAGVLYVIAEDAEGVSLGTKQEALAETVPKSLKEAGFSSVDAIRTRLTEDALYGEDGYQAKNTEYYEVTMKYSLDGGKTWLDASEDNFPVGGISVTLKYPTGTAKDTHDFVVSHMFTVTSEKLGTTAGETEQPEVTKTDDGLEVVLNGLSPVSVTWKEASEDSSDEASTKTDDTKKSAQSAQDIEKVAAKGATVPTGDLTKPMRYLVVAMATALLIVGLMPDRKRKMRR